MDRITRNRVILHVSGQRKIYRRDLENQDPENDELYDETIENDVSNMSIDGKQYFVFFRFKLEILNIKSHRLKIITMYCHFCHS